ncbi:MAG: tetratricopeptide repeat protein [Micromonosporaceae bacterium]
MATNAPPETADEPHQTVRVGERLLRFRQQRGLTQQQLAGDRYSNAFVSAVESGRRRASEAALRYFADRLEIEYAELRHGHPPQLAVNLQLRLADARHAVARGDTDVALAELRTVAAEAERYGLVAQQAHAVRLQATVALVRQDVAGAAELAERAARLLLDEPLTVQVPAIALRAECSRRRGDAAYAVYLLESTIGRLERTGLTDPDGLAELHGLLTQAYLDLGSAERAAGAAEIALELAPQVTDPERLARMHRGVARALIASERPDAAARSLDKAHALYDQLDFRREIGSCHWARGYLLARQGQLDEAAAALRQAREILVAVGARSDEAELVVELADVHRRRGDLERARELLTYAIGHLDEEQLPAAVAEAYRILGQTVREAGDLDAAADAYRQAVRLGGPAGLRGETALAARLLGDTLHAQGRADAGNQAYREGLLAVELPI